MMRQRQFWTEKLSPEEILQVFTEPDVWLTRRQIAQALFMTKNNTLTRLLEQMVADGILLKQETMLINRANTFVYRRA